MVSTIPIIYKRVCDMGRRSKREFERIQQRKEKRIRKKRIRRAKVLSFLLFTAIFMSAFFFLRSDFFNVEKIEVVGSSYYTEEEVIGMSQAKVDTNIFFELNRSEIKDNLLKDPYFTGIKFKYRLPSTVIIDVSERKEVAAMPYGDSYIVVDSEGIYLRKTEVEPILPLISNVVFLKLDLGETIECEDQTSLIKSLEFIEVMKSGGYYAKEIVFSPVYIECYILDGLVCRGTPEQLTISSQNGTINKVINDLFNKGIKTGTITVGDDMYISYSPDIS